MPGMRRQFGVDPSCRGDTPARKPRHALALHVLRPRVDGWGGSSETAKGVFASTAPPSRVILPMLTSDPHAWLYPLFARLASDRTFCLLSPSHQFGILRAAVAIEHPSKAATMDEWSSAARDGLLLHLTNAVRETPPASANELWRVTKGDRELRCLAVYLPIGIDLRLLEGDGFRRTQLCRDAPAVESLSQAWRDALTGRGWQPA
jgi:hypothetical protein